jgi:predicted MFS family arabinose efflux permease
VVRQRARRLLGTAREASATLRSDGRGRVLSIVAGGWFLVLGTRLVVPALLPRISAEFSLSNTSAGAAVTLIWLTYAAMQFPAGLLTDRWGERTLLTGSVLVGFVSVVAFAVAPVFGLFLGACVLFGLGTGLYGPPRVTLLSRIYPDHDGTALGLTFAAGNVGAAALPFVAGWLSVRFGWRTGLGVVAPAFLLVLLGLRWIVPDRPPGESHAVDVSPRHALARIASSVNDRSVLLLGGATTLIVFTYQGFTAFFPTYLVVAKGLNQATAATLFGAFFATGAVVQPVAGGAADRYGSRPLFLGLSAFTALTLIALPFVDGLAPLAALSVLMGVRAGLGPINNAYLVAVLPGDVQGASYGLLRTVYLGFGATGSIAVGALADAELFDEAFLFLAALTAVVFGLYALLPSRVDA